MNGRSPVGSTSTMAPFAMACMISRSKPEIMVKSANAAPCHLVQHPRGGDAALGGVEHEHAADIALAGELVVGARKYAAQAIEIVARGEAVFCDQRLPAHLSSHAGRSKENLAAHGADRCRRSIHSVIAGVDPAIHPLNELLLSMDARVKPAHDAYIDMVITSLRCRRHRYTPAWT